MTRATLWMGSLISICVVGLGCGSSSPSQPVTPIAGTTGTGGVHATAGNTGIGAAGTAAPASVMCGTAVCAPIALAGVPVAAPCCANAATNTCGTGTPTACMAPPAKDPRCPAPVVFGAAASPCCINNNCGVDASMFGMGCAALSTLAAVGVTVAPQHCDGTPVTGAAGAAAGAGAAGAAAGASGAAGAAAGASGAAAGASGAAAGASGATAGASGAAGAAGAHAAAGSSAGAAGH